MEFSQIWLISAVFIGYALLSRAATRFWVTAPMVFIALGLLLSDEALGVVQLRVDNHTVEFITEVTLAVILFSDASRLRVDRIRRSLQVPGRLLGIGLPLTFVVGALVVWVLYRDEGLTLAALVAATLAPTDAALGQPVVTDATVPATVRQSLNIESGLNDGLALPVVTVLMAVLAEDDRSFGFWVRFLIEQIGYGALVGVASGAGLAWLLLRACRLELTDPVFGQLGVLFIPLFAYSGAKALAGNGLIAAFVAGIAFGAIAKTETEHRTEYTEDSAQLLAAVAFFLFGNIVFATSAGELTWRVGLAAIGLLTIGRMLPVAVAMFGSGSAAVTTLFLGWFGPRGLATIVFGLMIVEEGIVEEGSPPIDVIAWTVIASVVLHGLSAAPGAAAYGRWWAAQTSAEQASMMESEPVQEAPVRWANRLEAWSSPATVEPTDPDNPERSR